jgi:endo-1,4-beta-xylanase
VRLIARALPPALPRFRRTGRLHPPVLTLLLLATLAAVRAAPVIVEAESGALGASFSAAVASGVTFVSPIGTATGNNPATASRVITYSVTFPATGVYELYARLRVGAGAANDDSFFYAASFGAKSPTTNGDWVLVNNLSGVGYTNATDTVAGAGTASASSAWKWVRLSAFNGGATPLQFWVGGGLTQTFQIGSREDGLDLDKLVFAPGGSVLTVDDLDNGRAGTFPAAYTPPGPPAATGRPKFLGSVEGEANFTRYFNQVTPGNAGKWGSVEGTRNVMNWGPLDTAYNLAKTNGYKFRLHTLVWGAQQPAWLLNLSAADQLAEINQWFAAVAARYPDIDLIDVVNEPLHDPPDVTAAGNVGTTDCGNYIAALGGKGATGYDWVLGAFRLARQYFPRAKLCLNDYSVINSATSAQNYAALINLLKTENLIDGAGIQAHAFETTPATATLKANLDTIAATGVPLYITEMDVDGPTDAAQLADMKRLMTLFWEHPSVQGVTLWGYLPGMWRTAQGDYLAYSNGAERPALTWLKGYVANDRPVVAPAQAFTVSQSAAAGAAVGTVAATDSNSGTVFQSWQITGGTGAGLFAINATTGALTVTNSTALAATTTNAYTLSVSVADTYTTSAVTGLTVNVVQPFAAWAAAAGLGGPQAAATYDADRDGVPNLLEYALGRRPAAAESAPPLSLTLENGSLVTRFTRLKTATGVTLAFQSSPDLVNWTTVTTSATVESTSGLLDTMRLTLPASAARYFLRLQVTQP